MARLIPTLCGRCQHAPCECRHIRSVDQRERDPLLNSGRWKRLCKLILARDPICRACGVAIAREVDHIIPRKARPDLALVMDNLQGLCKQCHGRKTRQGL